ncbi:MAG: RNase adapter RapZ [Acutalibacteraceae bacterium]|nr:RNase adapter RapZ [Acutalibacteraceae bacterium]
MELIIITGYSGAGKSIAERVFEDIGYFCVDNLPAALIKDFVRLASSNKNIDKVAVVVDSRAGAFCNDIDESLRDLKSSGVNFKVLFIEAAEDVLITRYKETRRRHPLIESSNHSIESAVLHEREMLAPLREKADYIIDTTLLKDSQLKERLRNAFIEDSSQGLSVHVMSFGFKYGPVAEADLVFDVRCLPNPYYIPELKNHTGLEKCVKDYVLSFDESKTLLKKLKDLLSFALPLYVKEGKSQLVIAFGCTGGKHRSVTFADEMYKFLSHINPNISISHRDIDK